MPKTKEELEQLKKELEEKKGELSEEELNYVTGGCGDEEETPPPREPRFHEGQRIHIRHSSTPNTSSYTDYQILEVTDDGTTYTYRVNYIYAVTIYATSQFERKEEERTCSESTLLNWIGSDYIVYG